LSKGTSLLFSASRSSWKLNRCEMASWPVKPTRSKASLPSGVVTRRGRSAWVYVAMATPLMGMRKGGRGSRGQLGLPDVRPYTGGVILTRRRRRRKRFPSYISRRGGKRTPLPLPEGGRGGTLCPSGGGFPHYSVWQAQASLRRPCAGGIQ